MGDRGLEMGHRTAHAAHELEAWAARWSQRRLPFPQAIFFRTGLVGGRRLREDQALPLRVQNLPTDATRDWLSMFGCHLEGSIEKAGFVSQLENLETNVTHLY